MRQRSLQLTLSRGVEFFSIHEDWLFVSLWRREKKKRPFWVDCFVFSRWPMRRVLRKNGIELKTRPMQQNRKANRTLLRGLLQT